MTDDRGREVVVVSGATSGVGRAVAQKFGEEGAAVGLLARSEDGLEGAVEDVEAAGGRAHAVETDVSEYEQVEAAADEIEEELGDIDVWVNNAMVTVFSEVQDLEPDEYQQVTDVTYLGTVYGSKVALDRMAERGEGKLVQIGSALSYRAIPLQSAYCGAKFAIRGFTDSLRVELKHNDSDVGVTMVQLPAVNTPQFEHSRTHVDEHPQPVAPIYQPEVIADGVYWAAHNDRRELYIGRSTLKTIWGNKIAPWFADWMLSRNGYEGQFSDKPYDPDRPDNLYDTTEGDPGARGVFGDKSLDSSLELQLAKHREGLGVALVAMLLLAVRTLWDD
ncbi:SDR family oxidoreductase [Halomarina salina]|uniref:SDR family oxidoreductase n=1 Tax=Halomarina salina TaxID=1872699 RepID=A0ABD5RPD0_9EURY|nr:SDR family oxidoreductase [Halomarina salina]